MPDESNGQVVDSLTLRFTGEDENGVALHELRAAHVAEVLQGLVGLTTDFDKAGVFHSDGPAGSEVLVRPAQEGSFVIEVVRYAIENWETAAAVGGTVGAPPLASVIWWATRSARADVKDFDYLDNGNVKIVWQDDTAEEVPVAAWQELQKRKRRRKRHLRQIMAPLADPRVTALDLTPPASEELGEDEIPVPIRLRRADYDAVRPEDDIVEEETIFEAEARMSAIDFDDSTRWRVTAQGRTRSATVEDREFLSRVTRGLPISKDDVFQLRIREDAVTKNGSTRTSWTVLSVDSHRRADRGDDSSQAAPSS
ncbi:hypothetical protein R4P47_08165 [Rhodococcus sp. IEGM 1370]|uniref:hypothetical protein n=1 Tax=Rhodococcus sp. IEGM 1370 TaxID=3082222 RepID=UPI002954F192|nr:hypothetical protein [Rhodococcus sp. IEGM 1370]MDV8076529.1 hypothetical protein [Rhodococcus sp. IEGM 1370]